LIIKGIKMITIDNKSYIMSGNKKYLVAAESIDGSAKLKIWSVIY